MAIEHRKIEALRTAVQTLREAGDYDGADALQLRIDDLQSALDAEAERRRQGREAAQKAIQLKITEAQRLLDESVTLADEYGIGFDWRPFYGGGAHYYGAVKENYENDDWYSSGNSGWQASSMRC